MELNKILDYQKKDSEIIKLERELNSNENKKIYEKMITLAKNAQAESSALEAKAGEVLSNFENIKKLYQSNSKSADALGAKNFDVMSEQDLKEMEQIAKTITNNLNVLEKKLLTEAERVRTVLQGFEATKRKYNEARDKYAKHKQLFDEASASLMPQIEKIKDELKKLEGGIDATLLARYKQKRQDRIYPVFVPCVEKNCGGCRMELASASLQTLKSDGIIECEHCRRIIYK